MGWIAWPAYRADTAAWLQRATVLSPFFAFTTLVSTEMSVTAHLTEQFVLKNRFGRLNFKWLVVGAYFPDGWGIDRLFMAFDPGMHRDIGFGWLHSLPVPFLLALPVLFIFGRWPAFSFWLSMELHVLTDTFDTLGVKLFWPFSEVKYSLGIYPWHDRGTWVDLYGFFTSYPALLFEGFFLIWAVRVIRDNGHGHFFRGLKSFWNSGGWK